MITALLLIGCVEWTTFRIFNEFSERIYKSGIRIQPSGHHPKAATIVDSVVKFTVTPKMYATYSKDIQRFEVGKMGINPHLAVMQKFKFRSKNKVIDRVLVSQIKFRKKHSGGVSPIASVYIDRPPTCVTWSKSNKYKLKKNWFVKSDQEHGAKNKYVYVEDVDGLFQHSWRRENQANRSYDKLNDGKWHEIEMHAYPHKTKGFCRIFIDGILEIGIENAPTKSYHSGKHGDYAARIGIYRDGVNYNHTVEFDDLEIVGSLP